MFKIIIAFLVLCYSSYANSQVKRFDIIELKNDSKKENKGYEKKDGQKYAIVISSQEYNLQGKYFIVLPLVQNKKNYKGKFVHSIKIASKDYAVFVDKPRSVEKSSTTKSSLSIKENEGAEILNKFKNIL
jgi:hypothetical protein